MAYDKTALKTLITLDSSEVQTILDTGGVRGMDWFKRLWPYGVTTNTGQPTLATMAQAYDLSLITDAQLEAIMEVGVRAAGLNQRTVAAAPV